MKTLLAIVIVTLLSVITGKAHAIPVSAEIAAIAEISSVVSNPGQKMTIVGYTTITKEYYGWGGGFLGIYGKKKKDMVIPVYAASAVPEAQTYAMILAGLGLVAWRARYRLA